METGILRMLCVAFVLAASAPGAEAQTKKVIAQIVSNTSVAVANEALLKTELDSILARKVDENFRMALRTFHTLKKEEERNKLDFFGPENRTYKAIARTFEDIGIHAARAFRAAGRAPRNVAYYRRNIGLTLLTAVESANKIVRTAMRGRVKDFDIPTDSLGGDFVQLPEGGGGKKKNDGLNLLTQTERLQLMEDCLAELRSINVSLIRLYLKLENDVRWSDFLRKAHPQECFRAECLVDAFNDTKDRLVNFRPLRF